MGSHIISAHTDTQTQDIFPAMTYFECSTVLKPMRVQNTPRLRMISPAAPPVAKFAEKAWLKRGARADILAS